MFPYIPCSSRLKGNPRKAVNTGTSGPPHPIHAGALPHPPFPPSPPPLSSLSRPSALMPAPSASEARPPLPLAPPPRPTAQDLRMQALHPASGPGAPVSPRPHPCPLNTGRSGTWLALPLPTQSCGPRVGPSQGIPQALCPLLSLCIGRLHCRLDWEQSPSTQHRRGGCLGVFLQ